MMFETARQMVAEARGENERSLYSQEGVNLRHRELDEREARLEARDERLATREEAASARDDRATERDAQADIRERQQLEHEVHAQRET